MQTNSTDFTPQHPARKALQAPTDVDDVRAYFKRVGKDGALRDAYRLPGEVTHGLHKPEPALPEAPLIVLINSKSGGRTGPQTAAALRHALGYSQVRKHPFVLPAPRTGTGMEMQFCSGSTELRHRTRLPGREEAAGDNARADTDRAPADGRRAY